MTSKEDEQILVVQRDVVIPEPWRGIKTDGIEGFEKLVREYGQFKRRGDMESNPDFKQIIPYMVFRSDDRYFIMQRSAQGFENRLHNRYSLGIGGHINREDLDQGEIILEWANREFREEVNYSGNFKATPLGLLNDDSNEVGQVHLGYVLELVDDTGIISIRDEHRLGRLATLDEIKEVYDGMETWSQMVHDFLRS